MPQLWDCVDAELKLKFQEIFGDFLIFTQAGLSISCNIETEFLIFIF